MAKTDLESVDDYLALQPDAARPILEQVRAALQKALPGSAECISYQIPAYKLGGRVVVFFAGWKEHFSVYPATEHVVAALGDELARYERSKGTIRFPLSEKVPVRLIQRIAKLRAEEETARAAAKRAKPSAKAKAPRKTTTKRARPT
ncbi:MAG: DUF1801 domain-containing protein [Polyangiaceae bacterium]|jgi:uncharacterized protein YdhG (YjbR/CyaY superfamily)|nr:DUF1801 domain-containing protein [Polyangiaceae bacterium]MBK8939942.1 DUF1801 domain-containing protein [Polyangiaceae bacterium]